MVTRWTVAKTPMTRMEGLQMGKRLELGLGIDAVSSAIRLGLACDDNGCVVRILVFPWFEWDALLLVTSIGIGHVLIFLLAAFKVSWFSLTLRATSLADCS